MIAIDTNVLVYAHRQDSPHHSRALDALRELAAARRPWAVPWPCLHEFLAIVTHPRIFQPASSVEVAWEAIGDLFAMAGMRPLSETERHAQTLHELVRTSGVVGPKVHDARVAAICLDHGVSELWTADRDFSFFPSLRTRNPLPASS